MIFHRVQVATVILVLALLSICFWLMLRGVYIYIYIRYIRCLIVVLMEYDSKFVLVTQRTPTNSKTSSKGNHPGILKCPLKFKSWMTVITSEIKDRTSKPE